MLAYNRSVPGPCLRVGEGTEVVVDVENHGDLETTVHWHGLRLENRYDGTHETQDPIEVGGRFTYRLQLPDPGAYWFHPHIRQDYGQELGLYAPIIVEPADPDHWPRAHREIAVTVDDILLEAGRVAAFDREQTAYSAAAIAYVCPMHPDVISDREGGCPHCGMKLMPKAVVAAAGGGEEHHDHEHAAHVHGEHEAHGAHEHAHGGIEWEDDMVDVNKTTTPANTRWKLVDRATGAAGHDIEWKFTVGDQVKIRLVNEMDSDHPMHHPFHIHGAGRFLVLTRDGEVEPNLVWTDTVLVRTGEVLDLLLDVTHPGRWMAHCHIAEHHESGSHWAVSDAAGAGHRRAARREHRPDAQHRLPRAGQPSRRTSAGGGWRQHRLPDRRRARGGPRGTSLRRLAANPAAAAAARPRPVPLRRDADRLEPARREASAWHLVALQLLTGSFNLIADIHTPPEALAEITAPSATGH